jgi:type II secretory pathway pseudopilin PulG
MTLLELTVVILVLLSLISILLIGASAWKKGSEKVGCIIKIRNVQQMIRSHQNMNNEPVGASINVLTIANEFQMTNIGSCPTGGNYDHAGTIPDVGIPVMTCSLSGSDGHEPDSYYGW